MYLCAVTVIESGALYNMRDGEFYDYSRQEPLLSNSIAFVTTVSSVHRGPCEFPEASFDEDSYFLTCAFHNGLAVRGPWQRVCKQ